MKVLLLVLLTTLESGATTYVCGGHEVTKGTAVRLLVSGKVKECKETRDVVFSETSGTLKTKPIGGK